MAHIHREPYITLSGLTEESALITWGAFFFEVTGDEVDGRFKVIADKDLTHLNPPRKNSIGESSTFYGPARLSVREKGGGQPFVVEVAGDKPETRVNHAWVRGLKPDTAYEYSLEVKGEPWADEERRDWVFRNGKQGMFTNQGRYVNEFRTYPHADHATPDFAFAVIGDFGSGVRKPSTESARQREVAAALAGAVAAKGVRFILTTGDNIYAGGGSDSDWFFTFYQPYRYLLNRIPVYPSCGNHDTGESEGDASDEFSDDYAELLDNFYIRERFLSGSQDEGEAVKENGLFYNFNFGRDFEFVSIDTSKQRKQQPRSFERPANLDFIKRAIPDAHGAAPSAWRVPFFHHPAFCYGPLHGHTEEVIETLVPLFRRGGVRLVLSGHEHNFQALTRDGILYVLTGGAGAVRSGSLSGGAQADNVAWSATPHFLLCEYKGGTLHVTPYGELENGGLTPLKDVKDPHGTTVKPPFVVTPT